MSLWDLYGKLGEYRRKWDLLQHGCPVQDPTPVVREIIPTPKQERTDLRTDQRYSWEYAQKTELGDPEGGVVTVKLDPVTDDSISWVAFAISAYTTATNTPHDIPDGILYLADHSEVLGSRDTVYFNDVRNIEWLRLRFLPNPVPKSIIQYWMPFTNSTYSYKIVGFYIEDR